MSCSVWSLDAADGRAGNDIVVETIWRYENMRTINYVVAACAVVIAVLSVNVQGAFMVETWSGSVGYPIPGLANENYVGDGRPSSDEWPSPSRAVGVTAASAVYGGTGDHIYTFFYTPSPVGCLDVDNAVFAGGTDLGNGDLASGLVGGGAGLYNVYATWRESDNVTQDNANFTITSEGVDVSLVNVQQYGITAPLPPGSDTWLLIAEGVPLVTGRTYTVTQTQASNIIPIPYVSMRNHGVMWEFVEPIEPLADIVVDGGVLSLEEGGAAGQYTIALTEQPPTMIIVTAQVCEPNQITLNGESALEFTFTPDDWDVVRTVNVAAVEDDIAEAETPVWIMHMTDPNEADFDPNSIWNEGYGGLVTVNIMGDVPDIRMTESDGTTEVSEEGPTSDTYDVKLTFPPTDNVTVTIETDGQVLVDTGAGLGTIAELVFTPGDWQDDQPVTVTAVDDDVLEYAHTSQITHVAASLDGGYDNLEGREVAVSVDDNECGVWGYFELDFDQDCVVGLNDFAEFAAVWLECTQPYGTNCVDLR